MQSIVLVRGSGDIGSAVAHRLFCASYPVVLHDAPQPTATRRHMAFADAAFDGETMLEGILARRVDDLSALQSALAQHILIPFTVAPFETVLTTVAPQVLIDARMRKHIHPEVQRGLAWLTIGLGPNFVAGETTDLAVETSWGDSLGRLIREGAPLALAGEPRPIAGIARERYVYAPTQGVFRTGSRIGDAVRERQVIAYIDALELTAPVDGILRGLTHDGVFVSSQTKVIEVDPRGAEGEVKGIGERPARIAAGVLRAIAERERD